MTKVSIILPTYNGAQYIEASIASCLEQTYSDIELVVVDDCSTDETPQVLSRYADDSRVKIIRHDVNRKLPAALNTGFANASGSYLSWTSDDNWFAPNAIEEMVAYLDNHPDVGFVYSDYWLVDEYGQTIRQVEAGIPSHLETRCAIASFVYRREVYEAVGDYDPELFRIEDYDYWLRVAQQFKLGWLAQPLYYYRRHASSLTGKDDLANRAHMFDELQTRFFGPDPKREKRVLSQYYIADAFENHESGNRSGVLRNAVKAIGLDRSLLKNRGVLAIMMQALGGRFVMDMMRRLRGRRQTIVNQNGTGER